jgi:nitrate reductase alpha subunit
MLGFELKQREAKLAREQAARLEAARRKAAEEQSREDKCVWRAQGPTRVARGAHARHRIKKQQADLAEALRRRRIEAAEAEEAVRAQRCRLRFRTHPLTRVVPAQPRDAHLAEVEANNGVLWGEELVAIPRDEAAAGARGIARRADKLCLPASAQSALLSQDAPKNGPMFFELTTPAGRRTHAVRARAPFSFRVRSSAASLTARPRRAGRA